MNIVKGKEEKLKAETETLVIVEENTSWKENKEETKQQEVNVRSNKEIEMVEVKMLWK